MVIMRCTRKLLARIGPPSEPSLPSTTALGDWYARPVGVGHQRYVLLISARSRLPVVMAARDVKHLADHFPDALTAVLWGLGISARAIAREVEETRTAVIAPTDSRSHLGTLNDFAIGLWWQLEDQVHSDLVRAAVELAHTPVLAASPEGFFPDQLTRALLAE